MATETFDRKIFEKNPVLIYGAGTVSRFAAKMLISKK